MPFPALATNLVPRESHTDFSVTLEWPPGADREPLRTQWFAAWLRCSTLTVYCTPSEVMSGCTYEPKGTWFVQKPPLVYPALGVINSLPETPYCMPQLAQIYANTNDLTKNTDSTNIWVRATGLRGASCDLAGD